MDSNNISRMEMDALKEIGNIGVGKAATSLSKMLDKRISIAIPESRILPLIALADQFGGPENIVQSIYLKINGDLKGKTMLLFPDKVALLLVDLISGLPEHTTQRLDGESMSAFAEFGNIFVGNFLNGLSDLLNLRILPELPLSARDMVQSLMDAVLIELGRDADNILFIKSNFIVEDKNVEGSLVLFFDQNSLQLMLNKLREIYGINI